MLLLALLGCGNGPWGGMAVLASSSSTLQLQWAPPRRTPTRYEWELTDHAAGLLLEDTSAAFSTDRVWEGLKSGTPYTIDLYACRDAACERRAGPVTTEVITEAELWEPAATPLAGGPTSAAQPFAMVYGPGSPEALQGHVAMYYDPGSDSSWGHGVQVAIGPELATGSPETWRGLQTVPAQGLRDPNPPPDLFPAIGTAAAVPLSTTAKVRLFLDGGGHIFSLDSADLLQGHDFHTGVETVCEAAGHFVSDGACPPTVHLGDDTYAASHGRVLWPQQSDWRWDERVGSTMIFTADCDGSSGGALATWDGAAWVAEGDPTCPIVFDGMSDPAPVHTGLGSYKVYFRDGDALKVLYADARTTGDPNLVEAGDWEPLSAARAVTIDVAPTDFNVLWPVGRADRQVMYGDGPAELEHWVLVNP